METMAVVLAARILMPVPASVEDRPGVLKIDGRFLIAQGSVKPLEPFVPDERLAGAMRRAMALIRRRTGADPVGGVNGGPMLNVSVERAGPPIPQLGDDESYVLEISAAFSPVGKVEGSLRAATTLGALRGLETFLQLVEGGPDGYFVRGVRIEDRPRFPWRGLLVDSARHFMPMEVLKRNLDGMAAVKLNVLHWHLTDDQGFRAQSRRYPKLHEMGADGEYYTQDQLREIVAYAAARGIRVVPEFDMPGHVTSWLVGHAELATLPGPYRIEDTWGILDPALDPTQETVYEFLDGFLGEMAAIFPDAYMHIGGDENNGKHWNASERVAAFKREKGLADNHALQAHFNRRVAAILEKHGKKMVGWEEILHPALGKDIVIQSWQGTRPLVEAARQGIAGILSHGYYLDYIHTAARHYAVDPLPADAGLTPAEAARVLGGEACMWSEYVGPETIDSRIWPRMAAIAERFWSPATVTDVEDMYRRLDRTSVLLEDLGLAHERNVDVMARRLAGGGDGKTVRVIADVVEPVKVYQRGAMRPHTRHTPLTRLVDVARPDSREARRIAALIDAVLAGHAEAREPLAQAFRLWRWAGRSAIDLGRTSPLLAHADAVARDVDTVGRIGLEALDALSAPAPAGWAEAVRVALEAAAKPKAEVEIVVVEPVRRLVDAAAGAR
jgi:hexosaminidase